jgi:hypothetical protein
VGQWKISVVAFFFDGGGGTHVLLLLANLDAVPERELLTSSIKMNSAVSFESKSVFDHGF